jgi:hypothetical protein
MNALKTLLAIKDKTLVALLPLPFIAAELIFKGMHWTTHARVKTAVANVMGSSARHVHYKATGKHPLEEIMKDAEKNRHRKFTRKN